MKALLGQMRRGSMLCRSLSPLSLASHTQRPAPLLLSSALHPFHTLSACLRLHPLLSSPPLTARTSSLLPVSARPIVSFAPSRSFTSSRPRLGLEEFFVNQQVGRVGRSWRCSELRLKSYEDLQKLWFVLLKERNMLFTYKHECDTTGVKMANPERIRKVRKSMAHIKVVLGERYREVKEKTEPEGSPWRVHRAKVSAFKRLLKAQERRRKALPKQVHRQKETHPKRKKIKFRHAHPTQPASTEPAASSSDAAAPAATAQAQSA